MPHTPTDSSVPDVPSLSHEAQALLKEAVEDPKGRVVRIVGLDGLSIRTNRMQFVEKNNPRSGAIWESALQELETIRLIADKGCQREVFGVTKKGYEVGDLLSP